MYFISKIRFRNPRSISARKTMYNVLIKFHAKFYFHNCTHIDHMCFNVYVCQLFSPCSVLWP